MPYVIIFNNGEAYDCANIDAVLKEIELATDFGADDVEDVLSRAYEKVKAVLEYGDKVADRTELALKAFEEDQRELDEARSASAASYYGAPSRL